MHKSKTKAFVICARYADHTNDVQLIYYHYSINTFRSGVAYTIIKY